MEAGTLLLYVIGALFLGFVVLPLLTRLLQQLLPIVQQRCQATITWLTGVVRGAFLLAQSLVTDQGTLSLVIALGQQVGALIFMSSAVVLGAGDLLFTYATLGPLLGWEVDLSVGLFAFLDRLTALCIVALPIVFGFVVTDLLHWTTLTHFSFLKQGRVGAFIFACLSVSASLAIAFCLAVYRWLVMNTGGSIPQELVWMLTVPAAILLPLAVLLLVGLAVALTSAERFIAGVLSLLVCIIGLALGLVLGMLYLVDFMVALTVAGLTALPTTRPARSAVQARYTQMRQSIGDFRARMVNRLKTLVGETTEVDKPSAVTPGTE